MKKLLILLLVLAVMPMALAEFSVYETGGDTEIAAGDTVSFELNVSDSNNYTLELLDSEENLILSDEPMALVKTNVNQSSNQTNTTDSFYLYRANYSLSSEARVGEWQATVFNDVQQVNTASFQVIPDELRILSSEFKPFFKNTQDDVTAVSEITDPEEEVRSFNLTIEDLSNNTTSEDLPMKVSETSNSITEYELGIGELDAGKYGYSFDLLGENGTSDSVNGDFEIYSKYKDADRSDINVGIASLCGTAVNRFRTPGGGIHPTEREGSFLFGFINNASSRANITADLNVTFQNETEWRPADGEEALGPPIEKNYTKINETHVLPSESFSRAKTFPGTNRTGYYLARLDVSARCLITDGAAQDPQIYGTETFNFTTFKNFRVLVAGGETGGSGDPVEEPRPRDANQTGEESNETIEGDNDNPGQTPVPEPEPEPVPEPDPVPALSLNIESYQGTVSAPRGGFSEVRLRLENLANQSVGNLTIEPETGNLPGNWDSQSASVTELEPNETLNRSVYLNPGEDVQPGTYRVSIFGDNSERLLDVERVDFEVYENITETGVRISEAPDVIRIESGGQQTVPFLVENLGEETIENSTITVQNLEGCGQTLGNYSATIEPNASQSLSLDIDAVSEIQDCNATVIVSTEDGSYSFADMRIEIVPEQGVVPPELRFPVFASAWTLLLILYSVAMTRFELDSLQLKVPYLALIVGEAVIFLYIATEYYSIIPPEILPF